MTKSIFIPHNEKTQYYCNFVGAYDEGLLNTTCPQDILSVYASLNITSPSGTTTSNCPGTTMDMCTDRTSVVFSYNDTCSPAKMTSGIFPDCRIDLLYV